MDSFLADVRFALRSLARSRGFAAAAVLCLAIGLAANATMFGVVDTLLVRPPAHVRDAEGLARIYFRRTYPGLGEVVSAGGNYPDFTVLRDSTRVFAGISAISGAQPTLGSGPDAQQVHVSLVSHDFFRILGVRPLVGRFFTPDEDRTTGGVKVAVLEHGFWQRQFGGDRAALGKEIKIDKETYTVVGVAPKGFLGADMRPIDFWVPVTAGVEQVFGSREPLTSRNYGWVEYVARLKPGVTLAQASAQATLAHRRANTEENRREIEQKADVIVAPLLRDRGPKRGQNATVSLWLAGVAAAVLLIACANVANLLLVRAVARTSEVAVRLALGISRGRLVRQLLTESLVLAALGAAGGLLLAWVGGAVIRKLLLPELGAFDTAMSGRILAFTAGAALLTGVLCGLAPMLKAGRTDIAAALKAGSREGRYQRSGLRTGLLLGQMMLTLVLLVGAGLFVRSLRNARTLDLGYDVDRMLVAFLDVDKVGYDKPQLDAFYRRMRDEVGALPGIRGASLGVTLPFWSSMANSLTIPGRDSLPTSSTGGPYTNSVTPDWFTTTGVRILRGRGFAAADQAHPRTVAIVNEAMARLYWPGQDALGKCFKLGDGEKLPCTEIVGIAERTAMSDIKKEQPPQYWLPLSSDTADASSWRTLYVRTDGDPAAMVNTVRRAIQGLAPNLPFADVRPFATFVEPQIRPWRLGATMFGIFGAVALGLAAVGLYGVLAYTVAQRRHEIGVRMALGAQARDVTRLVVTQGMRVAVLGIVLGVAASAAGARALASQLFGVSAHDPAVFVAVPLVLLGVAVAASWIPARRAARVDPVIALRSE